MVSPSEENFNRMRTDFITFMGSAGKFLSDLASEMRDTKPREESGKPESNKTSTTSPHEGNDEPSTNDTAKEESIHDDTFQFNGLENDVPLKVDFSPEKLQNKEKVFLGFGAQREVYWNLSLDSCLLLLEKEKNLIADAGRLVSRYCEEEENNTFLYSVDLSGLGLTESGEFLHNNASLINSPDELAETLDSIANDMNERYDYMINNDLRSLNSEEGEGFKRIILFFNELDELVPHPADNEIHEVQIANEQRNQLLYDLTQKIVTLARRGNSAKINIIGVSRTGELLKDPSLLANLTQRIIHGAKDNYLDTYAELVIDVLDGNNITRLLDEGDPDSYMSYTEQEGWIRFTMMSVDNLGGREE